MAPPEGGLRRRAGVGAPAAAAAAAAADAAPAAATTTPVPSPPPPPPPLALYIPLLFPVLLMALTALSSLVVSRRVPAPYMDEIFHAPQTQRLCSAATPRDPLAGLRGANWDAKITTFPGLYLLGGAYAWLQAWMLRIAGGKQPVNAGSTSAAAERLCGDVAALRGLNCLLLALCLFPAFSVRLRVLQRRGKVRRRCVASDDGVPPQQNRQQQQQHQEQLQQQDALGTALAAAVLLPTHFFYGFLYYTDVGALLFLLLSASALQDWAEAHEVSSGSGSGAVPAALAAAAAGGAAVLMRQTNAVWYAFLVGAALLRVAYVRVAKDEAAVRSRALLPLRALAALGRHVRRHTSSFAAQLALLFSPPLLFAAYVAFVNEGRVALGDHDAHDAAATRHWAHPFYAAAFCALASGGAFFLRRESAVRLLARIWRRRSVATTSEENTANNSAARQRRQPLSSFAPPLVATLVVLAAALLAARHGTVAHPYLLADNRHYTFYAWRRTLGKHWLVRCAFAPVGAACCLLLASELAAGVVGAGEEDEEDDEGQLQEQQEGWLWVLGFALACAATLVPAGLIEPRYYTVPAVLALLHAPARLFERRRREGEAQAAGEASSPWSSSSAAAFDWSALVACLLFSAVNAATLYVFAYRPFTWPDGSTARFMW